MGFWAGPAASWADFHLARVGSGYTDLHDWLGTAAHWCLCAAMGPGVAAGGLREAWRLRNYVPDRLPGRLCMCLAWCGRVTGEAHDAERPAHVPKNVRICTGQEQKKNGIHRDPPSPTAVADPSRRSWTGPRVDVPIQAPAESGVMAIVCERQFDGFSSGASIAKASIRYTHYTRPTDSNPSGPDLTAVGAATSDTPAHVSDAILRQGPQAMCCSLSCSQHRDGIGWHPTARVSGGEGRNNPVLPIRLFFPSNRRRDETPLAGIQDVRGRK